MVAIHLTIDDLKWLLNGKSLSNSIKGCVVFPPEELRELPWKGKLTKIYIPALVAIEDALDQVKKHTPPTTHGMFVSNFGDEDTVCGIDLDEKNIKAVSIKEISCPKCSTRIMEFLHSKGMKW